MKTMAVRLATFLLLSCLTVMISASANDCQNTNNQQTYECTVKVKESIGINTTVVRLPLQDKDANVKIESGNQDDRFNLTFGEDSWEIVSCHLLDYTIRPIFRLNIAVTSSVEAVEKIVVNVYVQDISDWPPHFNHDCSNTFPNFTVPSSGTRSPWAFDGKVYFDAMFFDTGSYYLSEFDEQDEIQFDVDNGDCNVKLFAVAYYNNSTTIVVREIIAKFDTDRDLVCSTLSEENEIPEVKLWKNPTKNAPDNKYVKKEWLVQTGNNIPVIIDVQFKYLHTDKIFQWLCLVDSHFTEVVNTSLEVIPTGCQSDKYGGQCQFQCLCKNGATCHPFNGACQCAPGWISPDCTISIPAVDIMPKHRSIKYGDELKLKCQLYNMNSTDIVFEWYFNDGVISKTNVTIQNEKRFSILTIKQFSDDDGGTYTCEANDKSKLVSQDVKVIFYGCEDGFWGEKCNNTCGCKNDGICQRFQGCNCTTYHEWWGKTCDKACYCNGNSTCHPTEGFCQCEEWKWGHLCQHRCDCGGGSDKCLPGDGACVCRLGWSGQRCDFDLKKPAFIIGMIVMGVVILAVGIVVSVRYYKRRHGGYVTVNDRKLLVTETDGLDLES